MALTDTAAKNAKADPAKPAGAKLTDGQGLYLLVKSAGKYWRFDYRFADKRKTLALGTYPAVTLADARKARDTARALLAQPPNYRFMHAHEAPKPATSLSKRVFLCPK